MLQKCRKGIYNTVIKTEKKKTLLVIENCSAHQNSLLDHISTSLLNTKLISAGNYKEAIGKFTNKAPDIVVIDIHSSLDYGSKLITKIRRINPKTKIIVITIYSYTEFLNMLTFAGADIILFHDNVAAELIRVINVFL